MAGSVNKCILIGNVGKDPEMRRMDNGDSVANFSMATSETWRDKQSGERKERTEWHRVVVFNENIAKVVEQYVKKGSKVFVEGKLAHRKYTDKDGQERYITEVVLDRFRGELTLLDSAAGGGRPAQSPDDYGATRTRDTRDDEFDNVLSYHMGRGASKEDATGMTEQELGRKRGDFASRSSSRNDFGRGPTSGGSHGGGRSDLDDDIPFSPEWR